MSDVWRAYDEVLGRPVAVKVLAAQRATDAASREWMRTEAQAAARLAHPHITSVYDYGESQTESGECVPYVVMELVDGPTLAQRLASGPPLPPRTAMLVCAQVAAGLAAAHARGLVHRDIKPGNVILSAAGAKVVDFGIAAIAGARSESEDEGEVWGTPAYVAPERFDGGEVVPASDVYAVGLLLYRLLAGELPWPAETVTEMLVAHRYAEPAPLPSDLDVPAEVSALVAQCLSKDPQDRPTAADVARALAVASAMPAADVAEAMPTSGGVPWADDDEQTRVVPLAIPTAPPVIRPEWRHGPQLAAHPGLQLAAHSGPRATDQPGPQAESQDQARAEAQSPGQAEVEPASQAEVQPANQAEARTEARVQAQSMPLVEPGVEAEPGPESGPDADPDATTQAVRHPKLIPGGKITTLTPRRRRLRVTTVAGFAAMVLAAGLVNGFCGNGVGPGGPAPDAIGPGNGPSASPTTPTGEPSADPSGTSPAQPGSPDQRGPGGPDGRGSGGPGQTGIGGRGAGDVGGVPGTGTGGSGPGGGGSGPGDGGGGPGGGPQPQPPPPPPPVPPPPPPAPAPKPVDRTVTTIGGSVTARCVGKTARLIGWDPLPGFKAVDIDRGPGSTVGLTLEALAAKVKVSFHCRNGAPVPSVT